MTRLLLAALLLSPGTLPQRFTATVTAYCPGPCCCGRWSDGKTSTGRDAGTPGAAVDPRRIPYGTVLRVPGYGVVTADDTGALCAGPRDTILI